MRCSVYEGCQAVTRRRGGRGEEGTDLLGVANGGMSERAAREAMG